LSGITGHKRLQQRLEIVTLGQSFHGQDVAIAHLQGQEMTRQHRLVIHQHRTGPALATITGALGASEIELLAQHVQQGQAMFDFKIMLLTIHLQVYLCMVLHSVYFMVKMIGNEQTLA
jgi:hypothetical protein